MLVGRRGTSPHGTDEPATQLFVVAEADPLHQFPVGPMVGRVKQVLLPVLRVFTQGVDHLGDRFVEGGAIGGDWQAWHEDRPTVGLREGLNTELQLALDVHDAILAESDRAVAASRDQLGWWVGMKMRMVEGPRLAQRW
jgi:hypothetical protein